jgi:hypothetical protein
MAEGHIQRLKRLVVCPVCCNPKQPFEEISLYVSYLKRFACGAEYVANDDNDLGIRAVQVCRARTELSVKFLNEECAGVAA